jgi:hypothetical protein
MFGPPSGWPCALRIRPAQDGMMRMREGYACDNNLSNWCAAAEGVVVEGVVAEGVVAEILRLAAALSHVSMAAKLMKFLYRAALRWGALS